MLTFQGSNRQWIGGVLLALALITRASLAEESKPRVEVEEPITLNAAEVGELSRWCLWGYGAPHLVRSGEDVFISLIDSHPSIKSGCNNRWLICQRYPEGWRVVHKGEQYAEFQPCPLITTGKDTLLMSINPNTRPGGEGRCFPGILQFKASDAQSTPNVVPVNWPDKNQFSLLAYRGFGVDANTREVLLMCLLGNVYCAGLLDSTQEWRDLGTITFPIRACYPQVHLRNHAAHVLAIGDIGEPVEAWHQVKAADSMAFRRLFYTFNPHVPDGFFEPAVEIDSVDDTGGRIYNLDLHVDSSGNAYVLYLREPYSDEAVRSRFFPDKRPICQLIQVVLSSGKVVSRQVLLDQDVPIAEGPLAGHRLRTDFARYHLDHKGNLWTILYAKDHDNNTPGMYLIRLSPSPTGPLIPLDMKYPLRRFFTNTLRGGSPPSSTIDLFGENQSSTPPQLRYARVILP